MYLPFLWESAFCSKWPIALGYTRGHFSALVAIEPDCEAMPTNETAAQLSPEDINDRSVYLPLQTVDGTLLPIHFRSQADVRHKYFVCIFTQNQFADYVLESNK